MKEKYAITVDDLTVAYDYKPVLWDIDLALPESVLMCIVGPNGAGKSTLIKSILGIIKPIAGTVSIYGKPYAKQRSLVAYVPQKGSVDWDFPTTALDVVMMGTYGSLGWIKRPGRKEKKASLEALEKVGMLPFKNRQISQLSGGQQQRIAIARALVSKPAVILADEPTGNLDKENSDNVIELLLSQANSGTTLILVTHNVDYAKLCNKVYTIRNGVLSNVEQ